MILSAKDESYFKKEVSGNMPPRALEALAVKLQGGAMPEWKNSNYKIIHSEYFGREISVTVVDTFSNEIHFYKLTLTTTWSAKCLNVAHVVY